VNLPSKKGLIGYAVWVAGIALVVFIGYQFVKLNGKNLWFAATHSTPATICRLQTTAGELEKAEVAK